MGGTRTDRLQDLQFLYSPCTGMQLCFLLQQHTFQWPALCLSIHTHTHTLSTSYLPTLYLLLSIFTYQDWETEAQEPSLQGPRIPRQAAREAGSHPALVGPLPGVHQVVLLQVGQLGEALLTQGTLKWTLSTVHTQVDLEKVLPAARNV